MKLDTDPETEARPSNPLTILLVDDDAFNREGVRLYLSREGFQILEAGDEETAWNLAQRQTPAVAITDLCLPPDPRTLPHPSHNCGVRLAHRLKEAYPAMGVILFSAYEDRGSEILDLIRAGQRGVAYKLKGSQPKALLSAIHEVLAGRVVIDPEVNVNRHTQADELITQLSAEERQWVEQLLLNFTQLTPREWDVVQRLAAAHNTESIALALSVTPKTVENYIARAYDKLGLNDLGREAPHLHKRTLLVKACMVHDLRAGGPS
jgi:DNA-binding NarL/FixJ family response regulator